MGLPGLGANGVFVVVSGVCVGGGGIVVRVTGAFAHASHSRENINVVLMVVLKSYQSSNGESHGE
jgi:hypothetical protein